MTNYCTNIINDTEIELPENFSLVNLSTAYPDLIPFRCKQGICGTCRIKVISGNENITSPTDEEINFLKRLGDYEDNIRLACQVKISGPVNLQPCGKYKNQFVIGGTQ